MRIGAWTSSLVLVALGGCTGSPHAQEERDLSLRDFAAPDAALVQAAERRTAAAAGEVRDAGLSVEPADAVDGTRAAATTAAPAAEARAGNGPRTGEAWPVEGLVGQINGRPIFADAFFSPIDDELRQSVAMRDRTEGRRVFVDTVRREFARTVESELVVAEAESQLTPEQQQGLFAWIKSQQESTIAERGGSRAAAEASIEAESTLSLDEFMQQRRDIALARRLLSERVEPRAIVSWRDVMQEYERRRAEFNPQATVRIGRIRLSATEDAERIAMVRQKVAEGRSFAEIATELKLPEGGFWNQFELPPEGIRGLKELSDAVKDRLAELPVGKVSEPIEQRGFTMWLAVIDVVRPEAKSIYDREVQLRLRDELKGRREIIERERYIATLRSRWVTDDIGAMERRLVEIALERYWR
ncbi:MAG: hypothetical protein LW636_12525 [Planctomycetaceae bacterium]|jgi:hypothetical protein|nr:hypothetical protein [Planctomycetaceae bacterium]